MAMNEFIKRIAFRSLLFTLILSSFLAVYDGKEAAAAAFVGALWGTVNLIFLRIFLNEIIFERNPIRLIGYFFLKFPLIYGAGYLILSSGLPTLYAALGTAVIFPSLMFRKEALVAVLLLAALPLQASIDSDVPEVPNFITLLSKSFEDTPWIQWLHHWESVFFSILVAVGISLVFYFGTKYREMIPSGLQNFLEWVVDLLRNFIIEVLGPEEGNKYVPFLGTLFIYILIMNFMVLIPFMKAPTSSINITIALAICVFVLVQYLNFKNQGLKGYLYHLAGSPKDTIGWVMVPIMFTIELLTQFTRPVTLALRLFGNVLGEDILIGAFALFGVLIMASIDQPLGLPLQIPFLFLSLLTSTMQALVFTLLSTIYILLSMPSHEEEAH